MKKSRFSEAQIIEILREQEAGASTAESFDREEAPGIGLAWRATSSRSASVVSRRAAGGTGINALLPFDQYAALTFIVPVEKIHKTRKGKNGIVYEQK